MFHVKPKRSKNDSFIDKRKLYKNLVLLINNKNVYNLFELYPHLYKI